MKRSRGIKSLFALVATAALLSSCSIFDFVSGLYDSSSDTEEPQVSGGTLTPDDPNDESGVIPTKIMDINETNGDYDMPSLGESKLLVIPVKISNYSSVATSSTKKDIEKAFFGDSDETGWESLASFYEKSSFGKLKISGFVTDWWDCGYSTSQIASFTDSSSKNFDPTVRLMKEAVSWYKSAYKSKGTEFDSNKDGLIDGVWLVYSAPDYSKAPTLDNDVFWAYTYSDYSLTSTYLSNPLGYRYCWASYDFMYAGYGASQVDTHTYIHETGHLLGLDDYYVAKTDSSIKRNYSPVGGIDMMDNNIIDHDSFSKMALGWVSPIDGSKGGTFTLSPFTESGDCLIIPSDGGWNGSPFDEYILVEFYSPTGLNKKDSDSAYKGNGGTLRGFTNYGVRIFHVDARMALITTKGVQRYCDRVISSSTEATVLAHSNSGAYNYLNPAYRLIQLMDKGQKRNFDTDNDPKSVSSSIRAKAYADNTSLFYEGDEFSFSSYKHSFPNYYYNRQEVMNDGHTFSKKITITSLTEDKVEVKVA